MQMGTGFLNVAAGYVKDVEVSTVGEKNTTKLSFRMSKQPYVKGVDKKDRPWMNVSYVSFGKGAEKLAEYVKNGTYLTCVGELTLTTKEIKGEKRTFADVRVDADSVILGPKTETTEPNQGGGESAGDKDELPF